MRSTLWLALLASLLTWLMPCEDARAEGVPTSALLSLESTIVRGTVEIKKGRAAVLKTKTEKGTPQILTLTPASATAQQDLQLLESGDFLVARGHIQRHPSGFQTPTLTVITVESLGLKRLLGSWTTASWEVYEFHDFQRLSLYAPVLDTEDDYVMQLQKTKEFKYVLAPEGGRTYSIFLSNDGETPSVQVGSLELKSRRMILTFFDPLTGALSQPLSLLKGVSR